MGPNGERVVTTLKKTETESDFILDVFERCIEFSFDLPEERMEKGKVYFTLREGGREIWIVN